MFHAMHIEMLIEYSLETNWQVFSSLLTGHPTMYDKAPNGREFGRKNVMWNGVPQARQFQGVR